MIINPNVEIAIQKYIQNCLNKWQTCSIKDMLQNYNGSIQTNEAELRNTINNALKTDNLKIIDEKTPWDKTTVTLSKPFLFVDTKDNNFVVISKPRLRELSIENIEKRNGQIDSIDCFRKIITSAKDVIRICSPFIQKNVLDNDSFSELQQLFFDAFKET